MASLTRTYDQKKLLGQVYTPPHIVQKILDEMELDSPDFSAIVGVITTDTKTSEA